MEKKKSADRNYQKKRYKIFCSLFLNNKLRNQADYVIFHLNHCTIELLFFFSPTVPIEICVFFLRSFLTSFVISSVFFYCKCSSFPYFSLLLFVFVLPFSFLLSFLLSFVVVFFPISFLLLFLPFNFILFTAQTLKKVFSRSTYLMGNSKRRMKLNKGIAGYK